MKKDFDLISAFIDAGLHEKAVLREWDCGETSYHLVVSEGVLIREWLYKTDDWRADGAEERRDIENELLRQIREYLDERRVTVWRIGAVWYANRGKMTLSEDGQFSPSQTRQRRFQSRPEALLAACVAIAKDET